MESLTEKIDQSKSQKKSETDENKIQGKYKENNKREQKEGKQSNYWMQDFRKICKENFNLKEEIKILNNCLQKTQIYFGNDQLRVLRTGTSRGMKWSEDTILKGLNLRFTCGTRGYNYLRQIMAPLPSVRTLQRSIEHIKFNPGLLDSVFLRLQEMIHNMNENDRNCVLIFDEMSIEQRIDLDPSTGAYIGYVSLPGVPKQLASKALVFLLAGIQKRYKQVVAYHFTTGKAYHEAIVEVIMKILERCEQIGFKVLALVCDMGNRGLLARLGFSHKKNFMIYSRTHPFNANRLLYAMPDFIHVFKSLKEMFMKNKIIYLPDDVVHNEKLESNIINFEYIEWLEDRQLNMNLKFVPH
ncbi:Uncharacterized protein DBV15_12610 [Temnothorax longispinosus]|uniref:Transposable element P transposase-like RNase H domain-containing protein n=1 Tax=Temnothorax longispinosus TaxID=300112 RepID=A0A4S2KRL6_9HYME|nr:Uncharacterized protein DBV15_12610 [Temnothorax longispinosus]